MLFDKSIGRKRDVGGVVLASGLFLFGLWEGSLDFFRGFAGEAWKRLERRSRFDTIAGFFALSSPFFRRETVGKAKLMA